MEQVSFPSEVSKFAALERRIAEDLTLKQLEEIADQIFNEMTEKTRNIANRLLNKLEQKRGKVLNREIALLESDDDLSSKVERLKSLMFFLPPEEIHRHLDAIEIQLSLCSGTDAKIVEIAKDLKLLRLREEFRMVDELYSDAASSFASQMRKIAEEIQIKGFFKPLENLNEVQLQEIYRAGGYS